MSTKTTFKRVALVAVAAMGLGMVSTVSANAAAYTGTVAYSGFSVTGAYAGTGTTAGTQVVGGTATLTWTVTGVDVSAAAASVATISTTGVGTITSASVDGDGTTATHDPSISAAGNATAVSAATGLTFPNTTIQWNGAYGNTGIAAGETEVVTFTVTSTVAGTQTFTSTLLNSSGTPIATKTATITWGAATSTALSTTNSYLSVQNTTCVAAGASHAADVVAAYAQEDGVATATAKVCAYVRDASGNLMSNGTAYITVDKGTLNAYSSTVTDGVLATAITWTANAAYPGSAKVTITVVDAASNVGTLSQTFAWLGGTPATLALANSYYSSAAGGTMQTVYTTNVATDGGKLRALLLTYKDANGNVISGHGDANLAWTIDSSGTATAPTARTSDSLGATVAMASSASRFLISGGDLVSVDCSASSSYEKLTITAWSKNSAAAWISSNSVDYYCASGTVATVSVTPAATTVAKAGNTTVNVEAKDANGYPVPDGTSVSLTATNGSAINTPVTTTTNGKFSTAAVFSASSGDSQSVVSATAGKITASSTITVGSGEDTAAADAAAEATDAANAATDAANAAAEAADAATAAAQDAADAVAALSAQVATLISGLKAQLTALTNLVIKIQKKVKA